MVLQHCSVSDIYNVHESINNVLCISNENGIILSIREATAYSKQNLTVPKYASLKKGALMRCCFISQNEESVFVSAPLKNTKINKFEILKEVILVMFSYW